MESRRVFFVAQMVPLKVSIHHLIRVRHPQFFHGDLGVSTEVSIAMTDPWDWKIYLHLP